MPAMDQWYTLLVSQVCSESRSACQQGQDVPWESFASRTKWAGFSLDYEALSF